METALASKTEEKPSRALPEFPPEGHLSLKEELGAPAGMPLFLQRLAISSFGNGIIQRQIEEEEEIEEPLEEPEKEELLQTKLIAAGPGLIQRQVEEEEEELEEPLEEPEEAELLQAKPTAAGPSLLQRQIEEEEEEAEEPLEEPEEEKELVQTKLTIGQPGDVYEQEADRVAETATQIPSIQAKGMSRQVHHSPSTPSGNGTGIQTPDSGAPLSREVREKVEPALGADLSHVRVHSDPSAQRAAKALHAKAFAHRDHVWLGSNQNPEDVELMAHEAAHVVQQTESVQGRRPLVQRAQTTPTANGSAPVSALGSTVEASAATRGANVQEAGRSFARMAERTLGLEEGYVESPDRSAIGLPPEGEAQERSASALSEIAAATQQLRAETEAAAEEGPEVPEEEPEPIEEPQDAIAPEAEPEAVAAEIEAAKAPVEGAPLPVDEISGPGPESEATLGRLRSAPDIDPSLVTLGEAINERIAGLRERATSNATRASAQLQGEAAAQRAAIQSSMGASQQAASGIMDATRTHVMESSASAREANTQQCEDAHTRNAEITEAQTTRLQENIDGSVEEARTIFSDADEEVRSTGESEAQRGHDYAYDLARRVREMGRSEAAYYRRTEEDEDLGEDKADAVIDVANRFARQLERDGNNLRSDVREQTDEAREQITAEEEPTVSGLEEVGPDAVESVQTFLGSVDDAVDNVAQQGSDQLDAAETGALGEIDNLDQAAQGRGEALLAEGEAGLDAALTGGLLAQTNLAVQAGQMLDDAGRDTIDPLVEVGTTGAPYESPGEPVFVQRRPEDELDAGVPPRGGVPEEAQGEVLDQLDQVGPSLDQAADNQTTDLMQPLGEVASGADQAGSAWVDETQDNMESLVDVADAGLTEIVDGASNQLDTTLEQGETQAGTEVDRISQNIANNVEEVRRSVDGGVSEATDSLRGGVEEGNAHADETFEELPEEMEEAAEAQESLWGRVGHWVSEQLADTWQAIKGMADWGFILDLVVGIVVGVLVAVGVALLIGTGVGALLVAGALAGAAGFAAAQMSANVRNGDPLLQGVGRAAILGAFVGFGAALAGPGVLGLGLLAGTGVVMLSAGIGTVVANVSTGRDWDEHLIATVTIVGLFHAVMKPLIDRVPIRLPTRRVAPAEEPPGKVPSRPEPRPAETPLAGMSAILQAIRGRLTDPRAIEAFDAMFQKLRGDSSRMEAAIEAMEQSAVRRGGNLQDRLIDQWERAHPVSRGEALDEVPGVRNRAQQLKTEIEEYLDANPEVRSDLRGRIDAQIESIDRMLRGEVEASRTNVDQARASLEGIEGELRAARGARGVTGTGRRFPLSGEEPVEIDAVADRGRTWIDSKRRGPFGLQSNEGRTWAKYRAQANRQLRAARENPVEGRPPRVIWDWQRGVGADVASELTRMGIIVRGQRVHVPPPAITPVPPPEHEELEEEAQFQP